MRNLLAILIAVACGIFAYTEITTRLTSLETSRELFNADLLKKSHQKPVDQEQFMLIEFLSREFEKLQTNLESGNAPFDKQQALILDFYRQRIEGLEKKVEILKDKMAQIKFGNGAQH